MVDLAQALLHVRRVKNGTPSVQPLAGVELRALRKLKREEVESRFVFMTERAAPITIAGYRKMISRTGESAEFPFPVHPHMLRHACGYKLANDGRDTRASPVCFPRVYLPFLRLYLVDGPITDTQRSAG